MKNVIGIPARGDSFFPRVPEVRLILDRLFNGNNLNIAAPRRIGKTSILLHLLDDQEGDYNYIYIDTEDIDNEHDFFKDIVKQVLASEERRNPGRIRRLINAGHKFLGRIKGIKLMGQGIELADPDKKSDYKEDLLNLLAGIEPENGKPIVILIDEFPQTVQNIIDANPQDPRPAIKFLQANRELRLDPDINQKVRFILTGSIGLNHTVAQIGATAFINDLNSIEVGPLADEQASSFFETLLQSKNMAVSPEAIHYLLRKIEWLIPFYLQLVAQEIISKKFNGSFVEERDIDEAFYAIIQARNENHFNHYYSRLRKRFKEEEFSFIIELLERCALEGVAVKTEIIGLSAKYNLEKRWRQLLAVLVYDGYIHDSSDDGKFVFNSPILRTWWQKFICK